MLWASGVNKPVIAYLDELRRSEERFQLAAQATQDVIWDWDLSGDKMVVTDGIRRTLGYDLDEMTLGWWLEHVHPDDATRASAELDAALRSDATLFVVEYRFRHANGSYRHIYDRSIVVRAPDGKPLRMLGVMMDVTAQKQATARVEAANRELDSFAHIVSHDLKAPLRAIGSLAGWLQTDYWARLDDAGRQQLSLLVARAKRMSDLIDGILHYSRLGRVTDDSGAVSTGDVVRDIVDALILPDGAVVRVEGDLPVVTGARTALLQVFQNLIGNALKFNTSPAPEVVISARRDGELWAFSVRDNGPGIDPRHHKKIFEIFQTLAARDKVEGTGIGLAIVKKIVEAHGGTVTVDSAPGRGTTFTFTVRA